MAIDKSKSIMEILQELPEAGKVLARYGMGCVACMGSATESLENGAMMHEVDLDKMLEELEELAKKKNLQ